MGWGFGYSESEGGLRWKGGIFRIMVRLWGREKMKIGGLLVGMRVGRVVSGWENMEWKGVV